MWGQRFRPPRDRLAAGRLFLLICFLFYTALGFFLFVIDVATAPVEYTPRWV